MGDGRAGVGDANAGDTGNHHSFNWHKVWHDIESTGKNVTQAAKKKLSAESGSGTDLNKLGQQAKGAAKTGLNVIRGTSQNRTANEVSNEAARWIPGAGLLRQGARVLNETGVEGKVLDGKKGPLKAPSEKLLRETGKQAIGGMIPIPGGGRVVNEVLNHTGAKDKAVDALINRGESALKSNGNVGQSSLNDRTSGDHARRARPAEDAVDESREARSRTKAAGAPGAGSAEVEQRQKKAVTTGDQADHAQKDTHLTLFDIFSSDTRPKPKK